MLNPQLGMTPFQPCSSDEQRLNFVGRGKVQRANVLLPLLTDLFKLLLCDGLLPIAWKMPKKIAPMHKLSILFPKTTG